MKKHLHYFDLLRVLASLFVVLMHTAATGLRTDVANHAGWYVLAALSSLTFCAVPLFFMMSGYLLTSSSRTREVGVLFRERLPRLAVPLLFWSALYVAWSMWAAHDASPVTFLVRFAGAVQQPVNISLWFMFSLMGMYLISPVLCTGLRNLDRQGDRYLLALIFVVKLRTIVRILFPGFTAAWLNLDVLNYLDVFGGHLANFILGWYLGKTERHVSRPALCAASVSLWGIITAGTVIRSAAAGEYISAFQSQSSGLEILLAMCIFLLVKETPLPENAPLQRCARFLAPCTFPIYLMHNLLLDISYYHFDVVSALRAVLTRALAVYVLGAVIARLCLCVPYLSFLACGVSRRERS